MPIRRPGGLIEERLTYSVIGAFMKVHATLGFGFLERVYAAAMEVELRSRGHVVEREVEAVVQYAGVNIARQRLDMVVDRKLILEIKATETLHKDAIRQLYNYLWSTKLEVGLFLHFGREANFYRVVATTPGSDRATTIVPP